MNILNRLWAFALVMSLSVSVGAQTNDTIGCIAIKEVSVVGTKLTNPLNATQSSVQVSADELRLHVGHSMMDALSHTAGVQAMDIGVGFSKPMIRGLGFQRVAVTENGVKQEGQQWGADHGLEIDAFHVENVRVVKGPSSVLYGSDAMGGVVEILPPQIPRRDTVMGDATFLYQSVSTGLSGSAMVAVKRGEWFARLRYTERHWADYKVPADSFTYLSMRLPIRQRRLKNTAGMERSINGLIAWQHGSYQGRVAVSNTYQRAGFFSGAHGIPSLSNLNNDGDRWNIDMPNNVVNHLKLTSVNKWFAGNLQTTLTLGYQQNHREEWSLFHSHVLGAQSPEVDPDKELMFRLHTLSAELQMRYSPSPKWEHYWGASNVFQHNSIGGYSFLIPAYERNQSGAYYLATYRASHALTFSASARYDHGFISTEAHEGAQALRRHLNDYSLSFGAEYRPDSRHELKVSAGRAFRMPSVNELTSNGVHHGAFRHEVGDCSLVSEQGWQFDVAYTFRTPRLEVSLSPFASYYSHYISLSPTGQWSELPDAGQIYRYMDSPSLFIGGEVRVSVGLTPHLRYTFSGEYVHTSNLDAHTALPFSPPASMLNTLSWEKGRLEVFVESQSVAPQRRVCHNEETTRGYNLVHTGGSYEFPINKCRLALLLHVSNLLNTAYLNHLSFYRKLDLPEAGRDIQATIRLTF